jgi:anti-sigma B factor antagonist
MSPLAPPERFGWEVDRTDSWVRVAPVGELDIATRTELEMAIDELLRSGVERLILDLRGVSFMDSNGLRLALDLHAAARGNGFALELVPGPPHVQRIFEVTGTLDALPFVSEID